MTTFIDTNVLIDLLDDESEKHGGCLEKMEEALALGRVFISDIVYSEASMGMASKEAIDEAVHVLGLSRTGNTDEALYRAGRAYLRYKNDNEGPKNNVLPDFLIGAQAEVENCPLITSDHKRMTTYFPDLNVIQP
jgi:predicted nucleic acid-binding protein